MNTIVYDIYKKYVHQCQTKQEGKSVTWSLGIDASA